MDPSEVVQAICRGDQLGNPAAVFDLIAEEAIWEHAKAILDDPEKGGLVGPTLLQGIGIAFDRIQDKGAAADTVLSALNPSRDSLVYSAAQKAALSLAPQWDGEVTRRFYSTFEGSYRQMIAEEGDPFVSVLALEGAVMLPIYRGDERLLYSAMGLLLNEFPSVPDDAGDPAYLPVKALKLLGQCYDARPMDAPLAQKIAECVGVVNLAVDAEARLNLGLVRLYDAFRALDAQALQEALIQARDLFEVAVAVEEGRTDAGLFLAICQCYLASMTSSIPTDLSETVLRAQELVTERLLAFGGATSPVGSLVEMRLVQLSGHLDQWGQELATAKQWPDIVPSMMLLADTYVAVRQWENTKGLLGAASQSMAEWVMLPQIASQFIQVQEVTTKLEAVLNDPEWRAAASDTEVAFYELVFGQVRAAPCPKDEAAAELDRIRAAAEPVNPALAQSIAELQSRGENIATILTQVLWQSLESTRKDERVLLAYGPAQDIYDKIASELKQKLAWLPNSLKWQFLLQAVRLTAHYFFQLYAATPGEKGEPLLDFLFAATKDGRGLGKKATEAHLRDHFYGKMRWGCDEVAVERESGEAVPGRPDLKFRFPQNIIFPIEVKREISDISRGHIHQSYVAQAQSYAAGTRQIGFLFVLDVTPKELGIPLKNAADYWYVDHRPVPGAEVLDYVIVVVFPANRYSPSDHSWRRKKTEH